MVYQGTSVFSGMLSSVGLEYESPTYGADSALTIWDARIKKATYKLVQDLYMEGGIRDSRSALSPTIKRSHYEGIVEGDLINGLPFAWALGDYAFSAGTPATHTIYPQRHRVITSDPLNYLRSYTLHGTYSKPDGSTSVGIDVLGATVKSATFRLPLEAAATYSLNYIAKSTATTGGAPTFSTANTMGSWNTTVLMDENTTVGTGFATSEGAINGLNSVEVSIDNSVLVAGEFGVTTIKQPWMGSLREGITCTIDRKYIDNDMIPSAITEPFSLRVSMVRTTSTDQILLDINDCRFMDYERGFNYDSAIENSPITIRPTWLKVVASNSDASYQT